MVYKSLAVFIFITMCSATGFSQEVRSLSPLEIEDSVLTFLTQTDDASVITFKEKFIHPEASISVSDLKTLRSELKPYLKGIGAEGLPGGVLFLLSGSEGQKNLTVRIVENRIHTMEITAPERGILITGNNISAIFDSLEHEGISGLVSVIKDGNKKIERPFGSANKELNIPVQTETIFGVGSRPIDFTIAAVFLLDQKEMLNLDDPIDRFIEEVPDDKRSMTIRHLLNGKSGLPDFFDTEDDWNPDLAWVDRDEAIDRLMNIELIFEPGSDRRHSHAAFGLLAAIVEIVSGKDYYSFIREEFLDPAGMGRTGEYGESRGLHVEDFAVGYGPEQIGLPNIPPNWGPTSWLVKGSGGMYSTLSDLQQFYRYLYHSETLDEEHKRHFIEESVSVDGSMRGFELFSVRAPSRDTEVFLFLNETKDLEDIRKVFRALERYALSE